MYKRFSYRLKNIFFSASLIFYYCIDPWQAYEPNAYEAAFAFGKVISSRKLASKPERFKAPSPFEKKFFLFFFHFISQFGERSAIGVYQRARTAEAQRALSATHRVDAFAMHQRRTLYTALSGPRPFRSPVDRFSAGSTTPALSLSRTPRCCAARRRNGKAHFRRRPRQHAGHAGHIYRLERTRTR